MPASPLASLASYVPGLIARGLAADPTPLTEPAAERFQAAVLFADISGFTPLAERLAQQGPAGTEALMRLLNDYFGQLIAIITEHGGDVVKFAGDALIALWPITTEDGGRTTELHPSSVHRPPSSLSEATLRAAQCSLAVQALLHQYQAAEGTRLSLRMGIGAGDVLTASVGGVRRRWEYLVAGEPLVQMGRAKARGRPGEVALSPEAWACVAEQCVGEALADGVRRLESIRVPLSPRALPAPALAAEAEPALRTYIPGAILARLDAGQTEWLAELRRLTLIFVSVTGLNYDAPEALAHIQAVMHALQNILYQYEGSLNQFIVDDKGTIMVMAFGLPPLTHEDDPARGVQAALDMQAALRSLGKRSAIGLATGRVFCGALGNTQRRQYAVIGDAVNLSARLMEAAPDDCLCDPATYQAARARFDFETLPPLTLKGKADRVAVYRASPVQSKSHAPKSHVHLVGRGAERALLAEQLQALAQRRVGGVVVVEGEAGIGKSQLVDDLSRQARALNLTVFSGSADTIEKAVPYHAWRNVFAELLDVGWLTNPDNQRQHVLDLLDFEPDLRERAPLLNAVLPLDFEENELTRQMTGQVRADNTRELLLGLLQNSAERSPKVVIVEDAHWQDSASWALTLALTQRTLPDDDSAALPILLIVPLRPVTDLPLEHGQLLEISGVRRLRLESLPPEDIRALVCQRLEVTALPEALAALVYDRAEGHPLFSEELAYTLRDTGAIVIAQGECRIAPQAGDLRVLNLPETVEGLVTSRIDRLPPPHQLTLKLASVIGRVFAFGLLHDIHPIEADKQRLPDYLRQLEELELTVPTTPEPDLAYRFKHTLTREVAYNMLLFAQRRELHRAIAEWHERTYAADPSPFYATLAYHWSKAEAPGQAFEYLEKAGEHALHSGTYREAADFFREAVRLIEAETALSETFSPLRLARWKSGLGQAERALGQWAESRGHLEQAIVKFDRPIPPPRTLPLEILGQLVLQVLHRLWSARFVGRATDTEREKLLEAAEIYSELTSLYFLASEQLLGVYVALRILNVAESLGPSIELTTAYGVMGLLCGLVGLRGPAEAYGRRGMEAARQVGQPLAFARVLVATSLYRAGLGRWTRVRDDLTHAIEIYTRLGDWRLWLDAMSILAIIEEFAGEYSLSALAYDEIYASRPYNGERARISGLSGKGNLACIQGHFDEAIPLLEEGLSFDPNPDSSLNIGVYGVLAAAYWRSGKPGQARSLADKAARLIAGLGSSPSAFFNLTGYAAVAEIYLGLWEKSDPTLSQAQVRAACRALQTFTRTFPIGQPAAWLYQGLYDWLNGQPARARQAWEKSLAFAAQLEMPLAQGQAHYEIGRHAVDDERQKHLAEAAAIFERLGLAYHLELARAARRDP